MSSSLSSLYSLAMKKILITAFEPFGGNHLNASLEIANEINAMQLSNAVVEVVVLPVDRFRAIEKAIESIQIEQPDIVLMLGESGQCGSPTLERVAINMDDFPIPDNVGNQPRGELISNDGPVGYFSNLPMDLILGQLEKECIPATISNSAGLYLCNRLFYSVMHYVSSESPALQAGFIHFPYLHEQVAATKSAIPSMSRDDLKKVLCTIINAVADNGACQG